MKNQSIIKFTTLLVDDVTEMESNIELLEFINSNKIDIKKIEELKKEANQIQNLIRILQIPKEQWPRLNEIFGDFDILSKYLLKYNLKIKECIDIIFNLIIKNLSTNLLERQTVSVDSRILENYSFKTISKEEVQQFIYNGAIRELLEKDEQQLSLEKREQKKEFLEFVKTYCIDISELIECHRIIKIHYLDKLIFFNEEDMNKVIIALQKLKVTEEICNQVRYGLEKTYQKRKKQETKNIQPNLSLSLSSSPKKLLTDKEYNLIKRELRTYYDFYNNQEIRELSFEEKIYCISLLLKIGEEKKTINEFLIKTRKSLNIDSIDFFEWFKIEMERLKFYQDKYSLEEQIKELEQYVQEMQIINDPNNKEYKFWKRTLLEELGTIKIGLSEQYEYEYEISCAKKLLK